MSRKRQKNREKRENLTLNDPNLAVWLGSDDNLCVSGYTSLDQNPDIMTACRKIAELIGSMTIHLMANTEKGDIRINNELSRAIDINPISTMTRSHWMEAIVMNLLLYGNGNSIVWPHTWSGNLVSLEPIAASRVMLMPGINQYRDYKIQIDGINHDPANMIHFVHNPDNLYLWKGRGLRVSLKDVANNLKQASATEKGFMESKWKPSLIVKVDALAKEFANVEGRRKLREEYLETGEAGAPWIIPAQQFSVEQVKPLSLADLALSDMVQLDKKTVASIVGVPAFILGVGEYNKNEWNTFVQTTIKGICNEISQELTRKIILSPKMYLKFNIMSLLDWDIREIADVFGALSDRGIVDGNEVRNRIGMSPREGLDELRILENYIPYDMSGNQKKLVQDKED